MAFDTLEHRRRRGAPSKHKAKEMLRHGSAHGKPLTVAQKGFFGAVAGGNSNKRKRRKRRGK